jgi:hypothetical protein
LVAAQYSLALGLGGFLHSVMCILMWHWHGAK